MITGIFNDIREEGPYQVVDMKVTSNAETKFAMGHELTEVSHSATTTCAFTQSLFKILMWSLVHGSPRHWHEHYECQDYSELEVPIHGILASTFTSM